MLYWDEVLFPHFLATISGEEYVLMTDQQIFDECVNIGLRAVATFKFPKIALDYDFEEVTTTGENPVTYERPYFTNDNITYREIEILVTWMRVYWYGNKVSNADSFVDIYYDGNVKTYSRGNALDKYIKSETEARKAAKEKESNYSRVDSEGNPSLGDINE